jgi:hypothetical protein
MSSAAIVGAAAKPAPAAYTHEKATGAVLQRLSTREPREYRTDFERRHGGDRVDKKKEKQLLHGGTLPFQPRGATVSPRSLVRS